MEREQETPPPLSQQAEKPEAPAAGMSENSWAMVAHLLGLLGYLANGLGSIIGPLVLWLVKRDESATIAAHAKEALNFNISVAIYGIALFLFGVVTFGVGFIVAMPLMLALAVFHIVCTIIAAIRANEGQMYRYPLTLRLVK